MPDYGQLKDEIFLRPKGTSGGTNKPGLFLFRSGSLRDSTTAVSASLPNIIAITCSANTNNVLTKLSGINAHAAIAIDSGGGGIGEAVIGQNFTVGNFFNSKKKDTRLVLRYVSASFKTGTQTISTLPNKLISSSQFFNDHFINVPIKNNDDSFTVAYKTVNALNKKASGLLYTASLIDTGNSLSNVSSSLGENMAIGSTFKIRSGSLLSSSVDVAGKFTITSLNSGSVLDPDFSGTKVQVGGMKIGSSFKIGGSDTLFKYNIIQSGSGIRNKPLFKGNPIFRSQSLSIEFDPDDSTSALISGSGAAKIYLSGSGRIGIGTTDPKSAVDIAGDLTLSDNLIVEGTITANAYIVTQSITTVTSGSTIFGNTSDDRHAFTGSIDLTSGDFGIIHGGSF